MRGTMTSLTARSPAANTSSISRRSSEDSDSWAATSPRSSSSPIGSRAARGIATEQPDDDVGRLGQQPDDRAEEPGDPVQRRREQRAAASARCRASRLGASSPTTSVTNEMIRVTPMMPVAPASPLPQPCWIR